MGRRRPAWAGMGGRSSAVFREPQARKHATTSKGRRAVMFISSRSLLPWVGPGGSSQPRPRIWRPKSLMKPVASDGVYSLPMVKLANLPE